MNSATWSLLSSLLCGATAVAAWQPTLQAVDACNRSHLGGLSQRAVQLGMSGTSLTGWMRACWLAVIAVGFVVGVLGRMPLIAFVLCVFVASLPRSLLGYVVERRRVLMRDQMVGAARSLTSQFRAGLSDIEGLRAVARDTPMPLGRELRQVVADFDRGDDLHHALTTMKERLEIDVVSVFVITLLTCKTTGGRVSDAMGTIVDSLQELQRIERKRESDTAGGRTEVLVMALFPAFLAGLLWMIDPASIELLFSTFWGQFVVSAIFVLTYGAVRWAFWLITALE